MYTYPYPMQSMVADIVLLRRRADGGADVLLIRRKRDPFGGCWALPGGFMEQEETLLEAARRELQEETGLSEGDLASPLVFTGLYDAPHRDPRGRVISAAYAAWCGDAAAVAGDDAAEARWFDCDALPQLAFDHDLLLRDARHVCLGRSARKPDIF